MLGADRGSGQLGPKDSCGCASRPSIAPDVVDTQLRRIETDVAVTDIDLATDNARSRAFDTSRKARLRRPGEAEARAGQRGCRRRRGGKRPYRRGCRRGRCWHCRR